MEQACKQKPGFLDSDTGLFELSFQITLFLKFPVKIVGNSMIFVQFIVYGLQVFLVPKCKKSIKCTMQILPGSSFQNRSCEAS